MGKVMSGAALFTLAIIVMFMAGCGSGDSTTATGSNSSSSNNGGNNTPSPPASSNVAGVVATGSPVGSAQITITDVNGKTVSGTADNNGNFNISTSTLTPPMLIAATWTDFISSSTDTMYSYSATGGAVNVNPFTNAVIMALYSGAGYTTSPIAFNAQGQSLLASTIGSMITMMEGKLEGLYSLYNVPTGFNPFTSTYVLGSGFDNLLDMVTMTVDANVLNIVDVYNNSVIATAPLNNIGSLSINAALAPTVNSTFLNITSMSASSGVAGDVVYIYGTGFNSVENYVYIGGEFAMSSRVLDSNGNVIGLYVIVPPNTALGSNSVAVIDTFANNPIVAYGPSFNVTQQYNYAITYGGLLSGSINVVGYYPNYVNMVFTIAQGGTTLSTQTIYIQGNLVKLTVPPGIDFTKSYTITVTSVDGSKTSPVFTVVPAS